MPGPLWLAALLALGSPAPAAGARPVRLRAPARVAVLEGQALQLPITLEGFPRPEHRVFAEGLPPGAHFESLTRTLHFTPDAFQGGHRHLIRFTLTARGARVDTATTTLAIVDAIRTADPEVVDRQDRGDRQRLVLSQPTDAFTSHGDRLGKRYEARLCVPRAATASRTMPLRVFLHGADAELSDRCESDEFGLFPSDTDLAYWWGYGYPDPPEDYTARRVLALIEWVLQTQPGADPERVYLVGASMGGAGALTLGLLYPRHFAYAEAEWAQTIPRHQRPGRLRGLEGLWGSVPLGFDPAGKNPYDLQDVTRILAFSPPARELPLFMRHAKDDPVIHFGAAVLPSELTGHSAYQALELARASYLVVWDEGGHGAPDPVLGRRWWSDGYEPMHDPRCTFRRDRAFVAFTRSSGDDDPGDGRARDARAFDPSAGYAGRVERPGDTGWTGDVAGARNRWLRFDTRSLVDRLERFEVDLYLAGGQGQDPPRPGYPPRGDRRRHPGPLIADVTPRRAQSFRLRPRERVRFQYGGAHGEVTADAEGVVTLPQLVIGDQPTRLLLTRADD